MTRFYPPAKSTNAIGFKLLTIFLILAVTSHFRAYFSIDLMISRFIQSINNQQIDTLLKLVSVPGNGFVMPLILISSSIALSMRGMGLEALYMSLSTTISLIISSFSKMVIDRPRPSDYLVEVYSRLNDASFPSGHTMSYTVFFGFLLYLSLYSQSKIARYFGAGISILMILLVGFSRVYLGAHWPSDVVGGYLLGGAILIFTLNKYQFAYTKSNGKR